MSLKCIDNFLLNVVAGFERLTTWRSSGWDVDLGLGSYIFKKELCFQKLTNLILVIESFAFAICHTLSSTLNFGSKNNFRINETSISSNRNIQNKML